MKSFFVRQNLLITLSVILLFVFSACEENDLTYDSPSLVEFSNLSSDPEAVWVSTGSIWATTLTGNHDPAHLKVSLITPQKDHAVEIGYYIADHVYYDLDNNKTTTRLPDHDNWEFLETTAVAGEDYLVQDGGVITIPAYNSFGELSLELFSTADRIMYLVLEERDVKPSDNYKIFRLRITP